jgi:hypothetical protein
MFPMRYELHLHIKSKAIPVSGRGGRTYVSNEVRTSSTYKKEKLSPKPAIEAIELLDVEDPTKTNSVALSP